MNRKITKDKNFILLNINVVLVLASYATALLLGFYAVPYVKIFRTSFLLLSIVVLLRDYPSNLFKINTLNQNKVLLMTTLLFLTTLFSSNILFSISRTLTFIVPFLYIFFCIKRLVDNYGQQSVILAFCSSMNYIYMIPILTFFISGGNLGLDNIYGFSSEQGFLFVSNHFGWSSAIFLLSGLDYYFNTKLKRWRIYLLLIFGFVSFYLLLISGSRSALLSVGLALVVFIMYNKKTNIIPKVGMMVVIVISMTFFLDSQDSALVKRYDVTIKQAEEGEARLIMMNAGLDLFEESTVNWVFGVGLFNYDGLGKKSVLENYHNSYFEILFGGGVIIFSLFIYILLYQPVKRYFLYFKRNYLIIFPILIIPFFESNLTGGQFLFYPWFIFSLLFSVKTSNSKFSRVTLAP